VLSTLPGRARATRTAVVPDAGTPAGTVVLRSADLRVHGSGTVSAAGAAPSAGELAVFCRPVLTAPAVIRRDGRVLADAWLPDQVRLGELESHLGDGVIEAIVDAELAGRRAWLDPVAAIKSAAAATEGCRQSPEMTHHQTTTKTGSRDILMPASRVSRLDLVA
jgi:hypothetical protein